MPFLLHQFVTGLGMGTPHPGARAYMSYGYPTLYLDYKD